MKGYLESSCESNAVAHIIHVVATEAWDICWIEQTEVIKLVYYKGVIFRTAITVEIEFISKSQIVFETFIFVLKRELHTCLQFHTGLQLML